LICGILYRLTRSLRADASRGSNRPFRHDDLLARAACRHDSFVNFFSLLSLNWTSRRLVFAQLSDEEVNDAQMAGAEAALKMSLPDTPYNHPHTSSGLYFAPNCDTASPEYVRIACEALDCEAAYERARNGLHHARRTFGGALIAE
jgi:hypothetical protein